MTSESTASDSPQLVILEQPAKTFRFRYKSEMRGAHGSLCGERSTKIKKTSPEVELKNFNGKGIIRCSLYQANTDVPSPHPHRLLVHRNDMDVCDPHDLDVSPDTGYIALFSNMTIIHTAKRDIIDLIYAKKKQKIKFELGRPTLSRSEEEQLRVEAENEEKLVDLNQVRLLFEAFEVIEKNFLVRIGNPVFSNIIKNSKSSYTGDLKICHLSRVFASVAGGDELILLVDKLNTKKVQVRFFELDGDDEAWTAFGNFHDHHQYALIVTVPPYKYQDIDTNVEVYIELVRNNESDIERSAPATFRYTPARKRKESLKSVPPKKSSSSSSVALASNHDPLLNTFFDHDENVQVDESFCEFMQQVGCDAENFFDDDCDYLFEDICMIQNHDAGSLQTDGEDLGNWNLVGQIPFAGGNVKGFIEILVDKAICFFENMRHNKYDLIYYKLCILFLVIFASEYFGFDVTFYLLLILFVYFYIFVLQRY